MVTSTATLEVKTPKGRASYLLALIPQPLLPVGEGEQDFQVPLPVGEGFRVRADDFL